MDRTIAALLGAVAGLASMGLAHAAVPAAPNAAEAMQAASYADLLSPVPNAAALMKAQDAMRARRAKPDGAFQLAQDDDRGTTAMVQAARRIGR